MAEDDEKRAGSYREAGVDIEEGARAVELMREAVRSTYRPGIIGDIGGFGGLFAPHFAGMREPVLVSGTDGVGTKLKLAQLLGRHDTVGIDLVAMCANDILVSGAEPLFFLDYIAIGKVTAEKVASIVEGIAEGCRQAGCALLGGETAEHPGVMAADDYDLSGFCVGLVDRPDIVDGSGIRAGDVVLGLASSGLHSNGFSLVRKLLVEGREAELQLPRVDLGGITLGEALLTPTRIYARAVLALLERVRVKGMAHITGGGITENLNRVLPPGLDARVVRGAWRMPKVFEILADAGRIAEGELYRTFNMGIGFCVVVAPEDAPEAATILRDQGETVFEIGEIIPGNREVVYA
ncbi:MAG TPA: phosphoribosylformylglycinamidine cyclo-ligase [Coriobacteriia bacterium]|jgi:phosphoribosylformylglycinamidine cyclo-ligase